jgi:hypothetical protein
VTRRSVAVAAATLALALACVATAALAGERPAKLGHMAAAGAMSLSGPGGAILDVSGMRPGWSASGTVTLSNVGDAGGRLSLGRTGLSDVAGRGGGRLSAALVLRVEELVPAPRIVYEGSLDGLALLDLGAIAGAEVRTYRLTVTLPDTGRPAGPLSGDNAFQGASTRVDWLWTATTPEPTPTPTPTAPPPVVPPAPMVTPDLPIVVGGGGSGAPRLVLRIPYQRVLASKGITMFGTCSEPCGVRFAAQIATAPKRATKARVLLRGKVFHGGRTERRLAPGAEAPLRLKLTGRAVKTLKGTLRRQRRVAVVVTAVVRGSGGVGTVTRRIVLVNRGSTLRR